MLCACAFTCILLCMYPDPWASLRLCGRAVAAVQLLRLYSARARRALARQLTNLRDHSVCTNNCAHALFAFTSLVALMSLGAFCQELLLEEVGGDATVLRDASVVGWEDKPEGGVSVQVCVCVRARVRACMHACICAEISPSVRPSMLPCPPPCFPPSLPSSLFLSPSLPRARGGARSWRMDARWTPTCWWGPTVSGLPSGPRCTQRPKS